MTILSKEQVAEMDDVDSSLSLRSADDMLSMVAYDGNKEAMADALLAFRRLRDSHEALRAEVETFRKASWADEQWATQCQKRAESAEAELARMRPVVEAAKVMRVAYDHDGGGGLCAEYMQACHYLLRSVDALSAQERRA